VKYVGMENVGPFDREGFNLSKYSFVVFLIFTSLTIIVSPAFCFLHFLIVQFEL